MKLVSGNHISVPLYFTFILIHTAPSASPQNLTGATLNSRTISLSWSPPPSADVNGIIREYRVNVTSVESGTVLTRNTTTTSITIQSLHPYYLYRCVVSAYTVGIGPYTEVFMIRTPEDGMLIQVYLLITAMMGVSLSVTSGSAIWIPTSFCGTIHILSFSCSYLGSTKC